VAFPWLGPQDPGDPGRGQGRWPAGRVSAANDHPSAMPAATGRFALLAGADCTRARPVLHPVRGAHTVPDRPLEFTQAYRKDTYESDGKAGDFE
jgi:hypothetical protein